MTINSSGPIEARLMLVGEFPSEIDLRKDEPFAAIGAGFELSKMLSEAKIYREGCRISMVLKDRVNSNNLDTVIAPTKAAITPAHVLYNGKWVLPRVVAGIEALKIEILRTKPNVVCAFGNLALWALTGQWGIYQWRSSIMESTLVPGLKVIPTFSPSVLVFSWPLRAQIVHDLRRVKRHELLPEVISRKYNTVIRPNFYTASNALWNLIDKADAALANNTRMKLAADIETRAGHIACIAFAWSADDAVCIPLMCQHNPEGYWSLEEEALLVDLMIRLMRKVTIIGQNWNYDAQYIYRHWHFLCPDVVDTMIQHHSCFSSMDKNLAFLSALYLEDHLYWKDDRTNWTTGPTGEGEDQYWQYNCTDALRTFAINEVLDAVIIALGMQSVNAFQQSLAPVVLATMNRGIRMDIPARLEFSMVLQQEVATREAWMRDLLGYELNIKSPKQMQAFFYEEMGQKPVIKRDTHKVTTNEEALHKIAAREPILKPVVNKVLELRSLGVFHSTFVMAALDIDNRIRTSFNICGTETYRFASSQNAFGTGLNVQNVPKGGEMESGGLILPNVRQLFVPDPGNTFYDIDLDSADLRIVAWESDCKWLKEQFRTGQKPYVSMMKEYFQDDTITKKHNSYPKFKSTAHGSNYLGTAEGMAPRVGLDVKLVQKLQDWYFDLCPEIPRWHKEIKKQVAGRRYVQNAFGYRMYFQDKIEGTIFNQAVAWIPQSSVACVINRGYVNIHNNLKEVEVLLQVHDSLAGQFESVYGDWALRRIVEECSIVVPYPDPLVIPVGIVSSTKSWGECG